MTSRLPCARRAIQRRSSSAGVAAAGRGLLRASLTRMRLWRTGRPSNFRDRRTSSGGRFLAASTSKATSPKSRAPETLLGEKMNQLGRLGVPAAITSWRQALAVPKYAWEHIASVELKDSIGLEHTSVHASVEATLGRPTRSLFAGWGRSRSRPYGRLLGFMLRPPSGPFWPHPVWHGWPLNRGRLHRQRLGNAAGLAEACVRLANEAGTSILGRTFFIHREVFVGAARGSELSW